MRNVKYLKEEKRLSEKIKISFFCDVEKKSVIKIFEKSLIKLSLKTTY